MDPNGSPLPHRAPLPVCECLYENRCGYVQYGSFLNQRLLEIVTSFSRERLERKENKTMQKRNNDISGQGFGFLPLFSFGTFHLY